MALDLYRYRVSENSSRRSIIGRDPKAENVFPEDKAAKVRPSVVSLAGYHLRLSRGRVSGVPAPESPSLAYFLACARLHA